MDLILLATLVATATWMLRTQEQRRRIALLQGYLGKYQIEKHIQTLSQGYQRALGENESGRREQIFALLRPTAQTLNSQFQRFAAEFGQADADPTRVTRLPFAFPFATRLFPAATFDLREAIAVHARGIALAVNDESAAARDQAFTLSAELYLMQHTCHWFCRSRNVASARMLARHQTSYDQLVASVSPATRNAYCALTGGR